MQIVTNFKEYFHKQLSVPLRNRYFLIGDLILIIISVLGSFALRLELGVLFVFYLPQAGWMILIALVVKPIVYRQFGLYRRLWSYASAKEIKPIVAAVTTASVFVALGILVLTSVQSSFSHVYHGFPRATLVIDWLLSLVLVGGFRYLPRLLADSRRTTASSAKRTAPGKPRRILVVGAGDAGALVVREMQKNTRLNMEPICFVDDDPTKQKQQIHDVAVLGTISDLPRVIDLKRIQEVIFAIPSAPGSVVRQVADDCWRKAIPFRTMPSIYELIDGRVSVNRLREVEITDLLRRAPVPIDDYQVGLNLSGKRVLVTGAGGSIGRELCRQIAHWHPSSLILLGHGENSIFKILRELEETFLALPLHPVIADVRDRDRLKIIFEIHRPQVVFHVAAHKHVPLMEYNIEEAVTNNVLGTRSVAEVSLSSAVERMVMISSDKAICPSSVMGATKRLAELVVLDFTNRSDTVFSVVRFGNVLGSRGSVIPHFKHQIAQGGPVTVTHPEMRRYFMTIPEAVHLVLQAMALGRGGEVFVLKMGEQIRILDLAEDLIRLSGLEPGKDIEIVFTGIRPGEKLSEELWDHEARYEPTSHPEIVRLDDQDILNSEKLNNVVNELEHLARLGDPETILKIMEETIPGASIRNAPPPDVTSVM